MAALSVSKARAQLHKLVDAAAAGHGPIRILGKRSNAVLISEDDWRAIQEMLYLLSIPDMRQSIHEGLRTPVSKCGRNLKW